MAIEEPAYEVLLETKHYEIRRYQPFIVAEVDVDADFKRAGNSAFRVLAGYIFGDNEPQQKMQMTAPVESTEGVRMNMTAPVTSQPADGGGPFTYAFVMERKYTMESLPKPDNPEVRLVHRQAECGACVAGFSPISRMWTRKSRNTGNCSGSMMLMPGSPVSFSTRSSAAVVLVAGPATRSGLSPYAF